MARMDRIGTASFEDLVAKHGALHFMKRLAHTEPDGTPQREVMKRPSQQYVLSVINHLSTVRLAMAESRSFIDQVEIPPPESWLREMELDTDVYRQQLLDLFTIVVHSVLDRTLLLINAVCDFGIPPRECSLNAIRRATAQAGLSFSSELSSLRDAVLPIADSRHLFAHRGEHRDAGTFSAVVRAKVITQAWDAPTEGVEFNDVGALRELLRIMASDLQSVKGPLVLVLDQLCTSFLANLEAVGGPDVPSHDELARAEAMIQYFGGGEKPGFMK
jgi:hypothetical protein